MLVCVTNILAEVITIFLKNQSGYPPAVACGFMGLTPCMSKAKPIGSVTLSPEEFVSHFGSVD